MRFEKKKPLEKYAYFMQQSDLDVPPMLWIVGSFVAALAVGLLGFFVPLFLGANEPLFGFLGFIIVLDVMLGYPYLKGTARIESIEKNLPDALKQMADTLKTGATYEYALREVASAQYGALTVEMKKVLRKLEEGENFENSLFSLSRDVDSKLVRRVITIIVDTVRAGAALADILEEIAQDVKELGRIAQERKTKTMLQVIFMVSAGVIVAPFIFGLVSVVVSLLITTSARVGGLGGSALVVMENARDLIGFSIKGYIFVLSVAAGIMIGVMREGNVAKSLIYIPLLLLVAYTVFFLSQLAVGSLLGTG